MRVSPRHSSVGIVVVGDFNPVIFTPAWFALHELLPAGIANSAEVPVIHRTLAAFEADWLNLHATDDRVDVTVSHAPYVRLCDLVCRIFGQLLPHTPLRAIGINRFVHFPVGGMVEMDRVGRALAPLEPWGPMARELGFDGERGGMTSLRMSRFHPEGRGKNDQINVTVEPSQLFSHPDFGIYVSVNDHYTAGNNRNNNDSPKLMELLKDNFDSSLKRSEAVIDHIMSLATASVE